MWTQWNLVNEEYFGDNNDDEDGMVLVILEVDDDG